jgi:hypothetical protein
MTLGNFARLITQTVKMNPCVGRGGIQSASESFRGVEVSNE